jgi:hypothetical protein
VSLKNISEHVLVAPVKVVIDNITGSGVTVANADGVSNDGKPYLEFTTDNGQLLPEHAMGSKTLVFNNPNAARFSYATVIYGTVPEAASIIGTDGGTIEVSNENSPIFGLKLNIPSGAVDTDTVISISSYNPTNGSSPELSFRCEPSGIKLNQPIEIEFPLSPINYTEPFTLVVLDEENNSFRPTFVPVEYDETNGCLRTKIFHFTLFEYVKFLDAFDDLTEGDLSALAEVAETCYYFFLNGGNIYDLIDWLEEKRAEYDECKESGACGVILELLLILAQVDPYTSAVIGCTYDLSWTCWIPYYGIVEYFVKWWNINYDLNLDFIPDTKPIFAVTTNAYTINTNHTQVCQDTFGSGYRIADWNDIVYHFNNGMDPDDILGTSTQQAHAYVTRTGSHFWSGTRHYIASRNNHAPHSGYLSHTNLDNHLFDLGSWYTNYTILCYCEDD